VRSQTALDQLPPRPSNGWNGPRTEERPRAGVLPTLERRLTDSEADELRVRIYAALHRGGHQEWASETS
jgi:hypothetical protein